MITFQNACRFLVSLWRNRQRVTPPTVFLLGPPGIGKTSVLAEVAKEMGPNAILEVIDLTSRMPEDIGGLPFREDGMVRYSPQSWAARLSNPEAVGVLVFDDLPAASPATAAAVRQVVLDRRIHDTRLAPGVLVVVTGNRREDMAGAMTLPSHFRNSVCTLEMDADFEGWASWFHNHMGDSTLIPNFLRWKPSLFSTLPKNADAQGRFATPRSWTLMANALPSAEDAGCVPEVVAGFVGEGVATEFLAFREVTHNLPTAESVWDNPTLTLPNPKEVLSSPDRMISMCSSLGVLAARRANSLKNKDTPLFRNPAALQLMAQWFEALAWVVGANVEHATTSLLAYGTAGGSRDLMVTYTRGESVSAAAMRIVGPIREAQK